MLKKILTGCAIAIIFATFLAGIKITHFIQSRQDQVTCAVKEPFLKKIQAHIYKITRRSNVYELLRKSLYTFGIPQKGIIHIGAREAEELADYTSLDIKNILWIEADPAAEQPLRKAIAKHPGSKIAMFAASDTNGIILLHKTSNSAHSSSILKLKNHLIHYPTIVETEAIEVPQKRLDDYLSPDDMQLYNILVMDIQGAELIALRGAERFLGSVDAVITEVNYDELYSGCALISDLDQFFATKGFTRVDLVSVAFYTGDALYIKNKFFKPET